MNASSLIDALLRYSGLFLDATLMTLGLALSALGTGLILALVFALGELSRFRPLAWLVTLVVTILRGLPELLIIFFVYFGFTHAFFLLTDQFIELSPFTAGTIALSLIYSAYASQILRGAMLSVASGQKEAAKALGLTLPRDFLSYCATSGMASCPARTGQPVAGAVKGYGAGRLDWYQQYSATGTAYFGEDL